MTRPGGSPPTGAAPRGLDRALERLERVLATAAASLLICAFALMLGIAALQLFLRAAFRSSIPWGDIAARQLVIWVGFLGAFLATRGGKHFRIDVVTRLFPPRARAWVTVVTDLLGAVICVFLAKAGATFVTAGLDPHAILFLGIPQAAAAMIVPAGFALVALELLLRSLRGAARAAGGLPPQGAA
jgi:TRAP-type C4-dicarboxylate transport system permease small subunit